MNANTLKINIAEKQIFWSLGFIIIVFLGLYMYFVSASIVNVLIREEVGQEIHTISTNIGELEFKYLAKKDAITMELARSLGFNNIEKTSYVARQTFVARSPSLFGE